MELLVTDYAAVSFVANDLLRNTHRSIRKASRTALVNLILKSEEGCVEAFHSLEQRIAAMLAHNSVDSIKDDIQVLLDLVYEVIHTYADDNLCTWEASLCTFWRVFALVYQKSWADAQLSELLAGFLEGILDMVYKLKVFEPKPTDQSMPQFFRDNPALIRAKPSATNSNNLFISMLGSGLYEQWTSGTGPLFIKSTA